MIVRWPADCTRGGEPRPIGLAALPCKPGQASHASSHSADLRRRTAQTFQRAACGRPPLPAQAWVVRTVPETEEPTMEITSTMVPITVGAEVLDVPWSGSQGHRAGQGFRVQTARLLSTDPVSPRA